MVEKRHHRIRYSLTSLVGIVGLVGVGLSALTHSNPWWAIGLVYLTFLLLLLATICGLYGRSVFGGGFALGGFAWLVLLFVFSQNGMRAPDDWPTGITTDSQGNITGHTKGPYAVEENPLHLERICHRLASIFRDRTLNSWYMDDRKYHCFRVEAYCVATWLVGLFTGLLALLFCKRAATSTG